MTLKTKNTAIKQTALGGATGIGVTALLSLVTAAIGVRLGDPLALTGTFAAICVLGGAMAAAATGCALGKSLQAGLFAGGAYTLVCIIASLFLKGTAGNSPLLFGVAVLGVLGGVALTRGRKPNPHKRMKKYIKR